MSAGGPDRRRPFAALLLADLVSTLGSEMAAVALPWFVLVTTGSPARTGMVVAAEFAGVAAFGIPSGRLASRLGPRRAMLTTDALSVAFALLVPVLHWSGALSFPLLLVAGLGIGAAFPAHQSSQQLLLAATVGDAEVALTRAGGVLGVANETASFVGPAVGGALVAVVGAPWVLVVDAASFAVSFVLVAVAVPGPAGRKEAGDRGTLDGVRYLLRAPTLRRRVGGLTLVGAGYTGLLVCFPVLARERYGAGPALAGWLLASYGLGSVVGGLLSARTRRASDRGFAAGATALALTTWPLAVPLPAWGAAVCVAGFGVAAGVVYPRLFAALTARPPERLRAQVLTAATTLLAASGPVGGVAAGLMLAGGRSPSVALALVAVLVTAGALVAATATTTPVAPTLRPAPRPASRPASPADSAEGPRRPAG